jgi:aspartyl-tRNA(Asn)/glutamyl-tRNA(Gln) amidotransferase subunit A
MPDDVLRAPLHEVAGRIERRELSPVELTSAALAAIERANPVLNAFRVVMADQALVAARQAEAEIAGGAYRGPLHGVPVAIKDLMDVAGETTPAGSKVLADRVATDDSEGARRLRAAGAIIVGTTHLSEFAFNPSSINPHYGPVHNPWNLEFDTTGSSSGSGAARAAGLVYGATGSDTGGSIRMPGAACGIVGLKPTFGRVSARGAVTLSWSLDHVGPMARTVRDTALLLDVLAGYDAGDGRTADLPVDAYADAVDTGVARLRIARIMSDGGSAPFATPAVLRGMDEAVRALATAGATIEDIEIPELAELATINSVLITFEAAAYYERFLRERPDDLGAPVRERLLYAYSYSPTTFVAAEQARAQLRRRVEERVRGYDLLALPGMPHEAPPLATVQQNTRFTGPFNMLGWPAIVVPTGVGDNNLPVSAQLVGKPWREVDTLRAAREVERDGPWQGRMAPDVASV